MVRAAAVLQIIKVWLMAAGNTHHATAGVGGGGGGGGAAGGAASPPPPGQPRYGRLLSGNGRSAPTIPKFISECWRGIDKIIR